MKEYDYYENVKKDVKNYLEDNPPDVKDFADCIDYERTNLNGDCRYFFENLYNLKEELNDKLFIDDGVTGYLFETGNAESLAGAMEKFLKLSSEEKRKMGKAGREKIEREFDRQLVVKKYCDEVEKA